MHLRISVFALLFCALVAGYIYTRLQFLTRNHRNPGGLVRIQKDLPYSENTQDVTQALHSDDVRSVSQAARVSNQYSAARDLVVSKNRLANLQAESIALSETIRGLQNEIRIKDNELLTLRENNIHYQVEKRLLLDSLTTTTRVLKDVMEDLGQVTENQSALSLKLAHVIRDSRVSEAELYYAKARYAESQAEKIFLSPSRKKESLMEALEVYKLAFYLGKTEAAKNIDGLEKSLFPALALVEKQPGSKH